MDRHWWMDMKATQIWFIYIQSLLLSIWKITASVQLLRRDWLFAAPWTAARQSSLSITNSQSLLKLMSIESVMPSNHLTLCRLLLLPPSIFLNISILSSESVLRTRWPKDWSFSFNINPSNGYTGLIFFRIDWLDLFAVQRLSRVFSNTTVEKHQFLWAELSLWSTSIHDYWKNQSFG